MIDILKQLNDYGWFQTIVTIILVIILIPMIPEAWKKFKSGLKLKSVDEIEDEKTEDAIVHLEHEVAQYKENRIHDREQSFQIQHELVDAIDQIKKALDEIKADALEEKIERMRWKILDFASALRNKQITCVEQFDYVLKTYDDYEKLLEKNNLTNGKVEESIKYIHEQYHEMLQSEK